MKIGYLITGLGTGGAEKHLLKLLPKTTHKKFVVSLTQNKETGRLIRKQGIKVYYLKLNLINAPLELIKLLKIFKKENPAVIDTYLIHSNLIGRFIGKLAGIKVLNSVRNNYAYSKIYSMLDKYTSRLVDVYTPNSKALLPYLQKINVPKSKIKIINNFIDPSEYSKKYSRSNYRKKLKIPRENKVIINVARFVPHKNQKMIISAFNEYNKKNSKSNLLLVGDGPTLKSCKKLAKSLKLKNVKFLKNRNDIDHLLNASDIFVLASTREGMSNALLEAMYFGKYCIVSNIPQNTELISKNCGYTFKTKSDLIKLMSKENKFGKNAKDKILKDYLLDNYLSKYNKIINKIKNK